MLLPHPQGSMAGSRLKDLTPYEYKEEILEPVNQGLVATIQLLNT